MLLKIKNIPLSGSKKRLKVISRLDMPLGASCNAALSIDQWLLSVKVKSNAHLTLSCLILISLKVLKNAPEMIIRLTRVLHCYLIGHTSCVIMNNEDIYQNRILFYLNLARKRLIKRAKWPGQVFLSRL
jgi:hypothetical protein